MALQAVQGLARIVVRRAVATARLGKYLPVARLAEFAGVVGAVPRQREGQRADRPCGGAAGQAAWGVHPGDHLTQATSWHELRHLMPGYAGQHALANRPRQDRKAQTRALRRGAVY